MKEFALYTAARLGIFVGCYAVVLGLLTLVAGRDSASGIWPLVVAVLVSAVVSAYALRGLRERFTARVRTRADRMVAHSDADQTGQARASSNPPSSPAP
jgi:membrane protein implicated in regulation of membrane protease activity